MNPLKAKLDNAGIVLEFSFITAERTEPYNPFKNLKSKCDYHNHLEGDTGLELKK